MHACIHTTAHSECTVFMVCMSYGGNKCRQHVQEFTNNNIYTRGTHGARSSLIVHLRVAYNAIQMNVKMCNLS